jgi:hypothetical protein
MGVEGPLIAAIVIPTHDSAVAETYKILRRLRNGLVPLVDGDLDGNMKVEELRTVAEPPNLVLQWRDAWAIEDTIGWVLKASAGDALADLQDRIGQEFDDIDALVALFKQNKGPKRLKGDYLAYEEVASVIRNQAGCRKRAAMLLKAVTSACIGRYDESPLLHRDNGKSSEQCVVLRLSP